MNSYKWFVTFIDDYTRITWVYLMRQKSEVYFIFKTFLKMICTQFNEVVKVIRFDKVGGIIYSGLGHCYSEHGMIHQTSCTNTPQHNGVAE